MSMPTLDPQEGWQSDPTILYNFLNQDQIPLAGAQNGNTSNGVNLNGQPGLDNMVRYQQTESLARISPGQLTAEHLIRSSPAALLNGLGTPTALLDQETLNSILSSGDMPPPNLPQTSALGLEHLRQNAQSLYGQYGDHTAGGYGLPLPNLAKMSAESAPGPNVYSHLQRGSLDASTLNQQNQANLAFSRLNRHSTAFGGDLQPQIPWERKVNVPRGPAQELQARLSENGASSHYPRSLDYPRLPDSARTQDFARGQQQDYPLEYGKSQSLDFGQGQGDVKWSGDALVWPNANDPLTVPRVSSGAHQDLGAFQALESRTFSGNSLDSGPDRLASFGENKKGAGNLGPHSGFGRDEKVGSGEEVQKQREKNRNAQKRFRERQKERMKDSQKQMEALTQQMNRLMQEKAELETRNRILEQVVRLNVEHVDQLQSNKEVLNIEQIMLLENYTEFFSKVKQQPKDSIEDAKKWLLGDLVVKDFQIYIDRIRDLYNSATRDSNQQALEDLNELILLRREHEKQGALFSCFYWAVYCWNIEETQKRAADVPPASKWQGVLEELNLTREQQSEILNARRRMLARLTSLGEQRRSMIAQLGLELLQSGSDKLHTCPVVQELRLSLEAERESVFNFLFTAVDETLTPAQEAFLDIASYPWCPDIWAIANLLAQQNEEPHMPLPAMEISSPVLDPILPQSTSFKLLTTPITAIGIGLRLKRGIAMCKTTGVLPKAAYPLLTQKQLATRTFLGVQCGRWKKWSTRDWQTRCLLADEIVSNAFEPQDEGYISP